nr:PREDICTED: uncharacterized protein LOC109035272 [Bemisia tabaci]
MCSTSVRYALVRSEICLPPVLVSDVTAQASFVPGIGYGGVGVAGVPPVRRGGSTLGPAEWACDCAYCPAIDRLRPDYYPICAERMGRRTTFDSWCHFDCENRCYEHTKQPHIFLYRGPCIAEPQFPGPYPIVLDADRDGNLCKICADQCRNIHEPVCARGALGQYLPFKSRCHLRCHNQCHFYSSEAQYYQVHDGDCRWIQKR